MMWLRIALAVAVVCLVWFVMDTGQVSACSCIEPGSPLQELDRAALVFTGKTVSVKEYEPPLGITFFTSSTDPTTVKFEVDTVWKGPAHETISLETARLGASCGYTFKEGNEYIVYSRDGETVNLCSRTKSLSLAAEDLAALGQGRTGAPQSEYEATNGRTCAVGSARGHVAGDLALLGLLAGTIAAARRRRT